MDRQLIRWLFLGLAIWGTVHPMSWFLAWFGENGWSLSAMIEAWHANAATSGLVWDLTIAAVALTVAVVWDTWRTRHLSFLVVIPATFLIGVSCGLPLYLYLRAPR